MAAWAHAQPFLRALAAQGLPHLTFGPPPPFRARDELASPATARPQQTHTPPAAPPPTPQCAPAAATATTTTPEETPPAPERFQRLGLQLRRCFAAPIYLANATGGYHCPWGHK
eukprot:233204-Pleurochrysis_carterae.AAC.1